MPVFDISRLAAALLANPCLAEALSGALQAGLEAKGRIDRNVEMLLGLLNLPTRADIARVLTKLEVLQGSLTNLNLKVDRLLDERTAPPRRPPTAPPSEPRA